jgi:deoxyribose-phosphate aldolase
LSLLLEERRVLGRELLLPDLWQECEIAAHLELAALFCRVDQVLAAAQALRDSTVAVGTVLGLVDPDASLSGQLAEARRAVRMGAREVALIVPSARLCSGELDSLRRDVSQVCQVTSSAGARLRVVLHTGELTPAQVAAGCTLSQEAGAGMVVGGSWFASALASLPELRVMRASVGPEMQVMAVGRVRTLDHVRQLQAEGLDRFVAVNPSRVLDEEAERHG